jgi:hypothetical protein
MSLVKERKTQAILFGLGGSSKVAASGFNTARFILADKTA